MKTGAMICRALSGHAWEIVGPVYVLKDSRRRLTFHCVRCDGWRNDTWTFMGRVIASRYYKHSEAYAEFIKGHNRAEARAALLGAQKERKADASLNSRVRPMRTTQARRRNRKSRPRDKRRTSA